ncbi:MAG: glycosyltransferase family 2 protein [Deltaproteobacteria bacterium]|jgi:glycosyltransferase involved in cell wall biosynthesis|nr:glycosyltransferase family 2 protein [Deltaproteobacteria bacterium]
MGLTYLVVIPLFNHAANIAAVVEGIFARPAGACWPGGTPAALVVNDGSTDDCEEVLPRLCASLNNACRAVPSAALRPLNVLRHERNLGKGAAILSGAAWAAARGFSHMITIDADGQHYPEDIPALMRESALYPDSIIVGSRDFGTGRVPVSSRFGRRFSWFWMRVQTGVDVSDMQSGFRIYPVQLLTCLKFTEKRFAFEMEVLVKASWAGFRIRTVPVRVHYPPAAERVSHFKLFYDNFRITVMNTKLTLRALLPVPFLQYEQDGGGKISVLRPIGSLVRLLDDTNTPLRMGFSTFVAVAVNTLPLVGLQSPLILLAISWLKLNRAWTLAVHHALWTPFLIALSVECGYFLRNGEFLAEISWTKMADELPARFAEWLLGSIVLAPLLALLCAGAVFLAAVFTKRYCKHFGED